MPRIHEMIESKYLKKEDVGEDGTVVTVAALEKVKVSGEDEIPEYKWTMQFDEFPKPMVLNSTNINLCAKIFDSDDTDDWIGKKLIVYSDPNISFGGKLVGGIRVRAFRKAGPPKEIPKGVRHQSARNVDDLDNDPPF